MSQIMSKSGRKMLQAAVAMGLLGAYGLRSQAAIMLTYDLRLPDGTKNLVVKNGDIVTINLFAQLSNNNTNKADDGVLLLQGSLTSILAGGSKIHGSIDGDISPYANPGPDALVNNVAPFANSGTAYAGSVSNAVVAGDTDLMIGSLATTTPAVSPLPWFAASSGTLAAMSSGTTTAGAKTEMLVGTFHFTVNDDTIAAGDQTSIVFTPRSKSDGTAASKQVQKFTVDGQAFTLNGSDTQLATGAPIILSAGGPPPAPKFLLDGAVDGSTTTTDLGDFLKGSSLGISGGFNNTGASAGNFTLTGAGDGSLSSVNPPSGSSVAAGGSGTYSGSIDTSTAGSKTFTVTLKDTTSPSSDLDDVHKFTAKVGTSAAGETAHAVVLGGASYAGLQDSIATDAANFIIGTTATLLQGTNTGDTETIGMSFRGRHPNETPGSATHPPIPATARGLISDVLDLTGTDGDKFVLQMTYDPTVDFGPLGETGAGNAQFIYLASLDTKGTVDTSDDMWVPAVQLNHAFEVAKDDIYGSGHFAGNRAYNPATDFLLGTWGVDTAHDVVWSVLDHNSQFAAIPEPASITLFGLGAVGLMARRRRRA